jgi:hypothetical protein
MFSSIRKHHQIHAIFLLVAMGVSFGFSQVAHASMMQEHKHGHTSVCIDGGCLEHERQCVNECLEQIEEQEEEVVLIRTGSDTYVSAEEGEFFDYLEIVESEEKVSESTRGPPALVWLSSIIMIE